MGSAQEFDIGSEQIDALYHYAKFQFECGNYSTASEFLYHYRTLSTDPERNMSALWGKLAATILQQVGPPAASQGRHPGVGRDARPASTALSPASLPLR